MRVSFRRFQNVHDIDRPAFAVGPQPKHAGTLIRQGLGKPHSLAAAKNAVENALGFGQKFLFSNKSPGAHAQKKNGLVAQGAACGKDFLFLLRGGGSSRFRTLGEEQNADFAQTGVDDAADRVRVDRKVARRNAAGAFLYPARGLGRKPARVDP